MAKRIVPSHQTCTKCGETFPYTTEYFYKCSGKDYLRTNCKSCHYAMTLPKSLQWQKENPERAKAAQERHYAKPEKQQKRREQIKAWMKRNPEKVRARVKRYRQNNRDKINSRRNSKASNWRKNNPAADRALRANYRARKRNLPNTFTAEEWQSALDYFNGCCAVCGRQLNDLFGTHTAAADHWIPLISEDCPGTVATNMVPLCHGQDGCNNSKHSNLPEQWLVGQFGKAKARAKLAEIQTYFESIRKSNK